MKKLFLAAVVLAAGVSSANAQALATATASATIVAPINIAKTSDLNFGNLAVLATAGDVVTLEPSAAATRTTSGGGGVTFPAATGTVTSAQFTVSGAPNYTFQVTLPSGVILDHTTSPGDQMFANNFKCNYGATGSIGTLDGAGVAQLFVGADLLVAAAQPAGFYQSSTPFLVAVNYN